MKFVVNVVWGFAEQHNKKMNEKMLKASNHKNETIKSSWETELDVQFFSLRKHFGVTDKNIFLFMLYYSELDHDVTHLQDNNCLEY